MSIQALPLSAYAPKKANPIRQAMNIQAQPPSAQAPIIADPIRLASASIQALDRVGEATSEEIETAANEIMRGATEIAQKLSALASAVREHTKIAHEHITEYCDRATSVLEGVRDLQAKLEEKTETQEVSDDRSIIPAFFKRGPDDREDQKDKETP